MAYNEVRNSLHENSLARRPRLPEFLSGSFPRNILCSGIVKFVCGLMFHKSFREDCRNLATVTSLSWIPETGSPNLTNMNTTMFGSSCLVGICCWENIHFRLLSAHQLRKLITFQVVDKHDQKSITQQFTPSKFF